ncbi:hypothetical protein CMK11_20045 [Candidatus Poribacteria bacterium]|nr:hypothetical protein [Candidatus Poribacteria bacterium]
MAVLSVTVTDDGTDAAIPCRVYLTDADGGAHVPATAHVAFHVGEERHFLCDGAFDIPLADGAYVLRVERGPEYTPAVETVTVGGESTLRRDVVLARWIDMNARGWYSGDLHVHRDPTEMPLAVQSEDLNVGTNIVYHNTSTPAGDVPAGVVDLAADCAYTTADAEVERLHDGPGAVVLLGMREPIPTHDLDTLYPTDMEYIDLARAQGAHVDGEKPFWRGTPVNAAHGGLDSMGVVPNHFHRQKVMRESARWGALPQETQFLGDEGFARWILDLYYRYLNCGIRLPASGGTASGIMPSPLGYCRTYVRLDEPFSYHGWFGALRAGRSFATNGPMLLLETDGHGPGALLRYAMGEPQVLRGRVLASSSGPLAYVELIRDGVAVRRVEADGATEAVMEFDETFDRSGWMAARCFERVEGNVRYAQTSPIHVFMGADQIASREAAGYFLQIVEEQIAQASTGRHLPDTTRRDHVMTCLNGAREYYRMVVGLAETRDDPH